MKRDDSAAVVTVLGLTAIGIGLSDVLVRYLRPTMARWLVISGVVMVVLAITFLTGRWLKSRSDRTSQDAESPEPFNDAGEARHRLSRAGWLLLLPALVAIVVDPGALGSYAVSQQSTLQEPAAGHFDLEDHLRSGSFAGQAVDISVLQLWRAVDDGENLDLLTDTPLSLVGFVVHDDEVEEGFLLARLVMACCAGDALAVTVEVRGVSIPELADDTWVRAEVTLNPAATAAIEVTTDTTALAAVVDLVGLEVIDFPAEPYLYPW